MAYRRRVDDLKALVISAMSAADATVVNDEFERVCQSGMIRLRPRRWLLEVIHSCRALDTGLQTYVHQETGRVVHSIGGALAESRDHGIHGNFLPIPSFHTHNAAVARVRNYYMHQAGAFPTTASEVERLLDDMNSCLHEVLVL